MSTFMPGLDIVFNKILLKRLIKRTTENANFAFC